MKLSESRWMKGVAIASLTLAVATGLSGCNPAQSEVAEQVITPVKLVTVPAVYEQSTDNFLARIEATERAQLAFQVAGELSSETVRMGEKVQRGEVIARIDSTDYQLAVDAAQARYDLAKAQFNRDEQLFDKKLISADAFDQSSSNLDSSLANLEKAQTDLGHTRLIAPFDGLVSQTFAKQYQLVANNQVVVHLINNAKMDVSFTMPIDYVKHVGVSDLQSKQFWVRMDNFSSVVIPAQFKEMSTQPNVDTNTFSATVTIERPEAVNLLAGMTGQVLVENSDGSKPFSLPNSAWVSKTDSTGEVWLFDAQSHQVSKVSVQLNTNGDVIGGVSQGDMIVSAGVENLVEGQTVKVWRREGGI
ncbi:efflux RND transporter periplasmic adaptor subunit [Vibrio sp. SCSIO 43136]|uniref:efflux RND transporter periplasmic adaptor subunit n=1 Tax=Vibrio sp. SCSIO 43136 TaxID=2819101 RepID=UPI002075A773|nr:efflux RND transporter periplasmic adaptor subunit [Vibrio sp. SCSIO 43136]USD64020.1 efflux RND transporter periplasmic adaptor subunit [Vibrio sp. SCSIO 43136]